MHPQVSTFSQSTLTTPQLNAVPCGGGMNSFELTSTSSIPSKFTPHHTLRRYAVIRACSASLFACIPSRYFIVVEVGGRILRTKLSNTPTWNETFLIEAPPSQEMIITLFKTRFFSRGKRSLGRLKGRIDGFLAQEEQTKTTSANGQTTITFRLDYPVCNPVHSRVFAYIVGIDKYLSPAINDLSGSVNDAKLFETFLMEYLKVPDSRVACLVDEKATRAAIISTFKEHLINNPEIARDDPIVIFYSGYGSSAEAPEGWTSPDNMIRTICPHDERMQDTLGQTIHGIPDRTIDELLRELVAAKGDNITVIFDSCHSRDVSSACGTSQLSPFKQARFLQTMNPLPSNLDNDLWRPRASDDQDHVQPEPAVFLLACGMEETAYEFTNLAGVPCGAFTSGLIRRLCEAPLDQMTYSDLITTLAVLIGQTPQVKGAHDKRIAFAIETARARDPKIFRVVDCVGDGSTTIDAGHANGIVVGTEFHIQVQKDSLTTFQSLGALAAATVSADSSTLGRRPGDDKFDIPDGNLRAVMSDWKNQVFTLKIFASLEIEDELSTALNHQYRSPTSCISSWHFLHVDSPGKADIAISKTSEGNLQIERLDLLVPRYAKRVVQLAPDDGAGDLRATLDAIARFNYLLMRHDGGQPVASHKISMELYRLIEHDWELIPENTLGNLFSCGEARVSYDIDKQYGVALLNYSDEDLYAYLFYFDPQDYSIQEWYLPPSDISPSLTRSRGGEPGKVTVGYGDGGGDPVRFTLDLDELSDTGFLKLFVSREYVDMGSILQRPPFSPRLERCELDEQIWQWLQHGWGGTSTGVVTVHIGAPP